MALCSSSLLSKGGELGKFAGLLIAVSCGRRSRVSSGDALESGNLGGGKLCWVGEDGSMVSARRLFGGLPLGLPVGLRPGFGTGVGGRTGSSADNPFCKAAVGLTGVGW